MKRPWARAVPEVLASLDVDPDIGLSAAEVAARRKRHGPNRLRVAAQRSAWRVLVDQFASVVVALLVAAAVLAAVFGTPGEALSVVIVLVINAVIGFVSELRAVRSMEALRRMGQVTANVRREGRVETVRADQLVPGDIVVVDAGDRITADLRLVQASRLQADESTLTGESVTVAKSTDAVLRDAALFERSNMLFKGSAVVRGAAVGVVVATGMATEIGRISQLVVSAKSESTPLECRLDRLGRRLIWATLAVAGLVIAVGLAQGKETLTIMETGIALAVATIPEGLPIVATIALAHGMRVLARRNVLVNRLSAVETLGATTIICSDKTGTLTENRMSVERIALRAGDVLVSREVDAAAFAIDGEPVDPVERPDLRAALEVGMLCTEASVGAEGGEGEPRFVGDPTETALLEAGFEAGLSRRELLRRHPEVREEAFDPSTMLMATVHESDGMFRVAVKGAPEAVLEHCAQVRGEGAVTVLSVEDRRRWRERAEAMASDGLRVLAVAAKTAKSAADPPYQDLTLLGLVGMRDPPRAGVREALAACRTAGVRVVMVTGDQPKTARAIARAVGLLGEGDDGTVLGRELTQAGSATSEARTRFLAANVVARVSPEQKLRLIELHQAAGDVVAMTGDGVNDAPALRKADIGVAMGRRGTQVAREAADIVLRDDEFAGIVAAIGHGRVVFDNVRAFVVYLISCNTSEILVVAAAALTDLPLAIRPLQILFLNFVTDVFPALALGMGDGRGDVLHRPPRDPGESILQRRHWIAVAGYGGVITACVLAASAIAQGVGMDRREAVTVSFLTLAFAQLWHVFNLRDPSSSPFRNEITRNVWIWRAIALCAGLLIAGVYVTPLADALHMSSPSLTGWTVVLGASLIPLAVGEMLKAVAGRHLRPQKLSDLI